MIPVVAINRLGGCLKGARALTRDSINGKPYTQVEVGKLAGFSGSKYASLEQGDILFLSPEDAEAIAGILPVTVSELVEAMGYPIPQMPGDLEDDEKEALRLYRRAKRLRPDLLRVAVAALREAAAQVVQR